jgi:hypothetical protein
VRCITHCQRCDRYEFVWQAGPFFWRCSECMVLIPRDLGNGGDHGAVGEECRREQVSAISRNSSADT